MAIFPTVIGLLLLGGSLFNANDDDVQVYLKHQEHGKGYLATCEVILKNKTEQPKWFLILTPNYSLNTNILKSNIDGTKAFIITKYANRNKNAVIVEHFGEDHFRAIRVPAGSFVGFENLGLYSGRPINSLIIIETSELKINGKIAFLKWLPLKCTSDSNVRISDNTFSGKGEILAGDFFSETDNDKIVRKFPKGEIEFISISSENNKKYSFDFTGRMSGDN